MVCTEHVTPPPESRDQGLTNERQSGCQDNQ